MLPHSPTTIRCLPFALASLWTLFAPVAALTAAPPQTGEPPAIAAITRELAGAAAANRDGLRLDQRPGAAIERFHAAAAAYAVAEHQAGAAAADAKLHDAAAPLLREARRGRDQALLNAAHVEWARTSCVAAMHDVDAVLLDDPENAAARELRTDIAMSMAAPFWWWEGWRAPYPVLVPVRRWPLLLPAQRVVTVPVPRTVPFPRAPVRHHAA